MDVLSEKIGDVMLITLNRPDARNGMTPEMATGILDGLWRSV